MDNINLKFSNINYIGIATIAIGLLPSGCSALIPDKWIYVEVFCFLLFSIFVPLILFVFLDDIKKGFNQLSIKGNVIAFLFLLFFVIAVLTMQILLLFIKGSK